MSDVVPDSVALIENPTRNEGILKIGIFHADADVPIATRIRDIIRNAGYTVDLCEFHDAGNPKIEIIDDFTTSHHLVLWMATNTSLGDRDILRQAHYITQYAANCTTGMPLRFASLEPSEGYTLQLPHSLAAYTPLIEDDNFLHSLNTTMESIRQKVHSLTTTVQRRRQSSATPNAVTDKHDAMPRQLPPWSDVGKVVVQVDDQESLDLTAIPEPQGSRSDQRGSSTEHMLSGEIAVNVFNFHGSVANIQVVEDIVHMVPTRAYTSGEKQGNDAPKEGKPV